MLEFCPRLVSADIATLLLALVLIMAMGILPVSSLPMTGAGIMLKMRMH